jgi:predicted transcriptional regulator
MNKDKVLSALEGIVYGTVKEVAAKVDIGTSTVRGHINDLHDQGLIKSWSYNKTSHYAIKDIDDIDLLFFAIIRNPMLSAVELSEVTGLDESIAHKRIGRLRKSKKIKAIRTKSGATAKYRVAVERLRACNIPMRVNYERGR